MIAVKCPSCAKDFRLSPTLAGRVVRCTGCSKTFPVPKAEPAAPKLAAASPIKKGPPKPAPKPAPKPLPAERDDDDVDYAEIADDDDAESAEATDDDKPRRKKKKDKKNPRSRQRSPNILWAFLDRFPAPVRLAIIASAVSILLACIHPILYIGPIFCGMAIILVSGLMFLAVASQEGFMHVVAILFLPFYSVYYLITRWEETKLLVVMQLFGGLVISSIACLSPLHLLIYKTAKAGQQQAANGVGVVRFDPPPKVDPFPKRPESEKPKAAEPPTPVEKPKLPETPKISGDATIDGLLAKFDDWVHAGAAVAALNKIDPKKHRATVLPYLVQLVEGPKDTARASAVKALGVWGTPKEVPLLIQVIDQRRAGMTEAMESLAQIGDERGVSPIVRHLGNLHIRGMAEKSLQRFGPIAEKEVLQYFKTAPPFGRQSAANVLATIGTELSLPVLRPAAKELFYGGQVTAAIAAIERRIGKK